MPYLLASQCSTSSEGLYPMLLPQASYEQAQVQDILTTFLFPTSKLDQETPWVE